MTDNTNMEPVIHMPESALLDHYGQDYYTVELGGQRFTKQQWEVVQLYIKGTQAAADVERERPDQTQAAARQYGHTAQEDVRLFHVAMGQPAPVGPRPLPADRKPVRIELIREEFIDELIPALEADDIVETADAAIDILYVTYGLLVEMGIDAEPLFNEVQASNMSKLGADGKPIIAQENDPDGIFPGRVKKGPNYFKPNLRLLLEEQAGVYARHEDQ